MKYAILFGFLLSSASALGQSRMPPPTQSSSDGSNSGWNNSQTKAPLTGSDPADRVGTFQILLQAPPLAMDTLQSDRGFGLGEPTSPSGSSIFGYVGVGAGVGYTFSSLFELGGAFDFFYTGAPVTQTLVDYQLILEPFVKLNFGPAFKTGALNPFLMAGVGFGFQGASGSAATGFTDMGLSSTWGIIGFDIDPGLEWLVGGRWGFDAYIPLQFLISTQSHSQVGLNIGVSYGLVAYL